MTLTANDIQEMVLGMIEEYQCEMPEPGSTVGVSWPGDKVSHYVEMLKKSLVLPRLERFLLKETYEQINASPSKDAEYWVIAEKGSHVEWYDPITNEFGLGQLSRNSEDHISIGVRGDIVGVFCAI